MWPLNEMIDRGSQFASSTVKRMIGQAKNLKLNSQSGFRKARDLLDLLDRLEPVPGL